MTLAQPFESAIVAAPAVKPTRVEAKAPTALEMAYAEFDLALRIRQAKICSVLALVLVPACIGLDYIVYPELLWPLFVSRILCDLLLLPCFLLMFTSFGRRHARLLGNAPPGIPCVSICWMIYATQGVQSPYYAGLNIAMVGVILLIPYTLYEAGLICLVIVASYTAACLFHRSAPPSWVHDHTGVGNFRTLFNNLYFLGMTIVIALAACHYNSVRRFTDFRLRHELDTNNRELASTLHKLKETEVQLVQSEKMNALGKLSAGLLHEINNPLNFTFMALQVAEQDAGDNAAMKETLADIGQGMTRIRSVISDLRAFAYPSKISEENEFSMEEVLTTAKRLTAHEVRDIPVVGEGLEGCTALGAKTQIVHVLMNLLVNAAHALQKCPPDRQGKVVVSAKDKGDRLIVTVRDNGVGVPRENLPRLFEPFFTTKDPGQGTGLGLSISHTIIKNHGGEMHVTSELGQWTELSFDLPLPAKRRAAA